MHEVVAVDLLEKLETVDEVKVARYTFELIPDIDLCGRDVWVGVDPGVQTGVVMLTHSMGLAWQLDFGSVTRDASRVPRIGKIFRCMSSQGYMGAVLNRLNTEIVIIEDAAFNRRFGQAKLAEHRAAILLGLMTFVGDTDLVLVNPRTVWKAVMGSGALRPKDRWGNTGLPPDCCDALAMALYTPNVTPQRDDV